MFWTNRLVRASFAMLVCLGLLVALFIQRESLREAENQHTLKVISSSWKLSELVFEGQRLSYGLESYLRGHSSLLEVRTWFEVFWSRVDLVHRLDMDSRPLLKQRYQELKMLLERGDPLIYQEPEPDFALLADWAEDLSAGVITTRVTWIKEYGAIAVDAISPAAAEISKLRARWELVSTSLVSVIVIYLLTEIGFGSMAQRRESQLTRAARAASEAKSVFIANVSHEIRTPLNGILGMSRVLSDTALDREQRDCLDVLQESGGMLLATLNDVLDYSKLEAGEFFFDMERFDLIAELNKTRALFGPVADEKGLDLALCIDSETPSVVVGDARRMRQVIHNLISNAVKFTPAGGVTVKVSYVSKSDRIPTRPPGLYVRVEDTGPGIPNALLGRIFEPFGQADDSATRAVGGTGLGLTISRSICQSMGGGLSARNRDPCGAAFDVYLPFEQYDLDTADTRDRPAPTIAPWVAAGLRVVVVDDNRTNRLVLRKFLQPLGIVPIEFDGGQKLLDHMVNHDADLILLDVQMPGMTGVEATQLLRKMPRFQIGGMPYVVAVTANVMAHQAAAYLEAGMQRHLSKPVDKAALTELIHDVAFRKEEAVAAAQKGLSSPPTAAMGE